MVASFKVIAKPLGRAVWSRQELFNRLEFFWKARWKARTPARCFSETASSTDNIVKSTWPERKIPDMAVHEVVFENISRWEKKVALECASFKKKWTFKNLYQNSRNLAASLQKKFGLQKGDCQCILLPNCPEYPCIMAAGSMTGIVTTTVNPLYTPNEISNQIKITEARLVYTIPELFETCKNSLDLVQMSIPIVVVKNTKDSSIPEGAVDFLELINLTTPINQDPVNISPGDTFAIPFSSGTSGLPKGVVLTHRNIVANLNQILEGTYLKSKSDATQVVTMGVLPMFHIYGMTVVTLNVLQGGDRLVCLPKFEPKLFVQTIYLKKTELLFLVPPLIFFLAHHAAVKPRYLKNVRVVVNGAAPCGVSDIMALKTKISNMIMVQGYGMTETSPVITLTHKDRIVKYGSVGHPLSSTTIKIADLETGEALPLGKEGEIRVKGPQVMKGYFKKPDETKLTFDAEGFLRTGDVGYFDEDGDLYVADRIKELIKVKGFQVAPAEVEEVLRTHPKIADAGVVGIPHPTLGEAPKAYIVLQPDTTMTEEEVKEYVRGKLTSYKQLAGGIEFIKAIPRSSAGKILRRELVKLHKNSS